MKGKYYNKDPFFKQTYRQENDNAAVSLGT
jgi:hypothetical protein